MGNCKPSRHAAAETVQESKEIVRDVGELREELVWERRTREFSDVYETVRQVGEGAFATVFVVQKRLNANRSVPHSEEGDEGRRSENLIDASQYRHERHIYAAKILRIKEPRVKSKLRLAELRHEIDLLRKLDHPNILHLREVFWEERRLILVMEFCQGCMLSALSTKLSEGSVALVAKQLLQAMAYLHTRGVVHRDLKLDNVMVEGFSRTENTNETLCSTTSLVVNAEDESAICVKLIDFGLSRQARKAQEMGSIAIAAAGTLSTSAPEIVAGGNYEFPADIWSIGACIYKLIGGLDPFLQDHVEPNPAAIQRLEAAKIPWQPASIWAQATKMCKEFIFNCMRAKLSSRWKADEALRFVLSRWIPLVLIQTTPQRAQQLTNSIFPLDTPTRVKVSPHQKSVKSQSSPSSWDTAEVRSTATTHGGGDQDIANLHDLDQYSPRTSPAKPAVMASSSSETTLPEEQPPNEKLQCCKSNHSYLCLSPRTLHDSIQRFASYSDLKRAALLVAAHHVDHRRTSRLRSAFFELDADHSGEVSVDELRAALVHVEGLEQSDIDNLFRRLDYDHAGVIHYHEFLAATIEDDFELLDDEALRDAFDRLDCDDTGTISPENLRHILGKTATDDIVAKMIRDGDLKHNGVIDFDEFVALMRPNFNSPRPTTIPDSQSSTHL